MKDEMSDDEQFDAFLKGEGSLARQLQALEQAAPSAALDAAILTQARNALHKERPEAANDSAPLGVTARHPARLSWRWQVPVGIAATVLVGLVARQSFESDNAPHAYETTPPLEVAVPQDAASLPEAAPQAPEAAAERVVAKPVQAAPPAPAAAKGESARRADKPAPPSLQQIAPAPMAPPAPPAAPMPPAAPAATADASAPAEQAVRMRMRAARSPAAAPAVREELYQNPQSADNRAPAASSAYGNVQPPPSFRHSTDGFAAPPPPPAMLQRADPAPAPAKPTRKREFSGIPDSEPAVQPVVAAAPAASPEPPEVILARIEALLEAGKKAEAAVEWRKMRSVYPDHPIPDSTLEKIGGDQATPMQPGMR